MAIPIIANEKYAFAAVHSRMPLQDISILPSNNTKKGIALEAWSTLFCFKIFKT